MDYSTRYVSDFYDNLEKGEIVGQHCRHCDGFQLLPSPCCRHCQSMELDYVVFSKEAELIYLMISDLTDEVYRKSGRFPMAYGAVQFQEGPVLFMEVQGVALTDVPKVNLECPLPVSLHTEKIAGNFVPVAVLREKSCDKV